MLIADAGMGDARCSELGSEFISEYIGVRSAGLPEMTRDGQSN